MRLALLSLILLWSASPALAAPSETLWHMITSWTVDSNALESHQASEVGPAAGFAVWNPASGTLEYASAGNGRAIRNSKCDEALMSAEAFPWDNDCMTRLCALCCQGGLRLQHQHWCG